MPRKNDIKKLTELRRELHKYPELSMNENNTSCIVKKFVSATTPDKIISSSETNAFAAIYKSRHPRKTIILRCELDAVPVAENTGLNYSSVNKGVSHSCGHDGHMTLLCGTALILGRSKPLNSDIILLFQPAEETGEGAKTIIDDKAFLFPNDSVFIGFHNIPGYPCGKILLKNDSFCPASTGIKISIKGSPTHASTPHAGISPVPGMVRLLNEILSYKNRDSMITITHIVSGKPGYGVSPGNADIFLTARSFSDEGLDNTISFIKDQCKKNLSLKTRHIIQYSDSFPATCCHNEINSDLAQIFYKNGIEYEFLDKSLPWSEDFGVYLKKYKGVFFGIGSGTDQPELHSEDYDFPEDLIPKGIEILKTIAYKY